MIPKFNKKIFVSIVSYRDNLLSFTIESLMEMKSGMYDITLGIFEQIVEADSLPVKHKELFEKYRNNIRYKRIDPQYPDGVGWARAINAFQVNDEDFYYQIDSHMVFDENWDLELVKDYNLGRKKFGTDKIIIDGNCKVYDLDDNGIPRKAPHGRITSSVKYFTFQNNWVLGAHGDYIDAQDDITPAIHLCAGNLFTHSEWLRNPGINGRVYFDGEEQIITLTSFAAGYALCHPRELHAYHYNASHNHVTKQWLNPVVDMGYYSVNLNKSLSELYYTIQNIGDHVLEEYRRYSGVDYFNRKLERRAITNTIRMPEGTVDTWTVEDRMY